MDSLINNTLIAYEDYVAKQLPVIFMPAYTFQLTEIGHGLQGVTPQNPFNWLQPETWHY